MYRVSPFTYIIEAMLSAGVSNAQVSCADNEFLVFNPPSDRTCGTYMQRYIDQNGGYLVDSSATSNCSYCSVGETNSFLTALSIDPSHAWRDFGLLWVYIVVNIMGALFFYWLVRMPKKAQIAKEVQVTVDGTGGSEKA